MWIVARAMRPQGRGCRITWVYPRTYICFWSCFESLGRIENQSLANWISVAWSSKLAFVAMIPKLSAFMISFMHRAQIHQVNKELRLNHYMIRNCKPS